MKSLTAGLLSFGCLLAATRAEAHFSLDFPKSRSGEIQTTPCGPSPSVRGSTVTTFHPGETVTLQWNVFVQHTTPGLWRISIDDSGQDFPDPVGPNDTSTLPLFMDHLEVTGETMHEMAITLPNITCDNCTLQMLQYKYAKPPYTDPSSFYFQCADIVIAGDPVGGTSTGSTASSSSSATGSTSAGSSGAATTGGSGGGGPAAAPAEHGGCSVSACPASGASTTGWLAAALLVVARRRRARTR